MADPVNGAANPGERRAERDKGDEDHPRPFARRDSVHMVTVCNWKGWARSVATVATRPTPNLQLLLLIYAPAQVHKHFLDAGQQQHIP